jgi:hypothetical protein
MANQALHLTAIPPRSKPAGELVRYHTTASEKLPLPAGERKQSPIS